jgi:transcription initiation factor TFIID subunit TAF12
LRPDLISSNCNLNSTHSSNGETGLHPYHLHLSQQHQQQQQQQQQQNHQPQRISYNDLCFPKTSNYGSMKKKKIQRNNVGVDCRLAQQSNAIYA